MRDTGRRLEDWRRGKARVFFPLLSVSFGISSNGSLFSAASVSIHLHFWGSQAMASPTAILSYTLSSVAELRNAASTTCFSTTSPYAIVFWKLAEAH